MRVHSCIQVSCNSSGGCQVAYSISFVAGNLLSAMAAALEGIGTSAKMLRLCIRDLSSSEIQVATGDNGCNKKLLQVQASKQQLPDGMSYCKFWAIRLGTPCACGITTARQFVRKHKIMSCIAPDSGSCWSSWNGGPGGASSCRLAATCSLSSCCCTGTLGASTITYFYSARKC